MKQTLIIALLLVVSNLFAQQQDSILVSEIPIIKNNVFQHRLEIDSLTNMIDLHNKIIGGQNLRISDLSTKNSALKNALDSLNQLVQTNQQEIIANNQDLGSKIEETSQKTHDQITELGGNVDQNRLYWIIATLITLLLGVVIYWLLDKRISSNKTDVESQIRNTRTSLEEEGVKLDNKLVEVLETQLKLQQEASQVLPAESSEQVDHSLALKVADEIVRIQKNLDRMDEKTKGLKQLNSSVKRIQDNFASNGYELVEMLGKEYKEGMKAIVNFIQDEDFAEGNRVITRIIKPQVNYKGTMIQTAQIEVTEA